MLILIISKDPNLIDTASSSQETHDCQIKVFNDSRDPLDIMSTVCLAQTSHILFSIKKIMQKLAVIFVTSNSNLELGREVSQLGVYYYALKPLEKDAILDALKSIINLKSKIQY